MGEVVPKKQGGKKDENLGIQEERDLDQIGLYTSIFVFPTKRLKVFTLII